MQPRRVLLVIGLTTALAAPAAAGPATPVPGTVGLVRRELALRHACDATFRQITLRKRGDDPRLVKALTYPRVGGLDFDPAHKARAAASLKRFDTWWKGLEAAYTAAVHAQVAIVGDASATTIARVEAAARVALLFEQMASLINASEVPKSIRGHVETVTLYCDTLDERAEPIEARAVEARGKCAELAAAANLGTGWWTEVCVVPATAAP